MKLAIRVLELILLDETVNGMLKQVEPWTRLLKSV